MNRRDFFRGMIASATTAAIASHFNVEEEIAEEVRSTVLTDLSRPEKIMVTVPDKVFVPESQIWTSTAKLEKYWTEQAKKAFAKQVDKDTYDRLVGRIPYNVKRLVKACEADIKGLESDGFTTKQPLQIGDLDIKYVKGQTHRTVGIYNAVVGEHQNDGFQLSAGIQKTTNFLGIDVISAGYIKEDHKIIT